MDRKNKILLSVVVLMALAIVGLLSVYIFVPAPASGWSTYRNDQYGFEIRHPKDWMVAVEDGVEPKINIYKENGSAKPPFIHHHNVTQVSVFPKGVGTEGVDGEAVTSAIAFRERTARGVDFLLADGRPWATFVTFWEVPGSWESFGFVWAGVRIEDPSSDCVLDGKVLPAENCDLGVDRLAAARIVLRGDMDDADRETEKRMLETFRFVRR